MRKVSYTTSIKTHVKKLGGKFIDQTVDNYYNQHMATKYTFPEWVDQIALDYKKTSVQVINDLSKFRNSWEYTQTL